jgi:hypothetical protein
MCWCKHCETAHQVKRHSACDAGLQVRGERRAGGVVQSRVSCAVLAWFSLIDY